MNTTWLEKSVVSPLSQKQENINPAVRAEGPQLIADQAALSARPPLGGAQEEAAAGNEHSQGLAISQASWTSSLSWAPCEVANTNSSLRHFTLLHLPIRL